MPTRKPKYKVPPKHKPGKRPLPKPADPTKSKAKPKPKPKQKTRRAMPDKRRSAPSRSRNT